MMAYLNENGALSVTAQISEPAGRGYNYAIFCPSIPFG